MTGENQTIAEGNYDLHSSAKVLIANN